MNKIHISLNVSDVAKSQKFYETFLESPAHKIRPGYANFDLNNPPLKLAIQERMSLTDGEGKVSHLGIQVPTTNDVEAAIDRLSDAGFHLKEEKDEVCCYAKQDKVWVQDPDGNRWEVYTVTDEMESVESASCAPKENAPSCC
jgi:catechol 2,3-dioxygenase-like lactoylglutathione lyase family enzyme|tara:strand:- start:274 stop:702 length:429 start_codon:yes stop_codon:yes gene_type:complete